MRSYATTGFIPLLITALSIAVIVCGNQTSTNETQNSKHMTGQQLLVADPDRFDIEIQAAGTATISNAELGADGALRIGYAYEATDGSAETRAGSMTLTPASNTATTRGSWRTEAVNGAVYRGTLQFTFHPNGTADGTYDFAGNTYVITIFEKSR